MLIQQTQGKLRELKLKGMAEAYEQQLAQVSTHTLSFDDRFSLLVDSEASARENRKLNRLLKSARFRYQAFYEDIDFRPTRELDKGLFASLASCEWVRRRQNILLIGATGTGKSWLGCALGTQACRNGMTALFRTAGALFEEIAIAQVDGSLPKLRSQLVKASVLVIDDLGLAPINLGIGHVLLEIIDQRSDIGSLVITSQYPAERWHGFFNDPTLADAILDRIVHASHKIQLHGESMRKVKTLKKAKVE
jgi:DNA replication protein DnaC